MKLKIRKVLKNQNFVGVKVYNFIQAILMEVKHHNKIIIFQMLFNKTLANLISKIITNLKIKIIFKIMQFFNKIVTMIFLSSVINKN